MERATQMFVQGTTPTHTFRLSINTDSIAQVRISYAQEDKIVVEKTESDCKMGEKSISVTLTQQETMKLNPKRFVEVQLKIMTDIGTVLASPVQKLTVEKILNTKVLK